MTRSGSLGTVDRGRLTRFGRLLYDHLLSFKPTKTVPEFAREVGVSSQAVWDWLRAGTIPRRATLVQIAERVELPLDELLEAANLPSTEEQKRERAAHVAMLRASVRELASLAEADPHFSPEERATILRFLRSKPEDFLRDTDSWREFHHESPAAYEAERAEDQAEVYEPAPITSPEEAHGQSNPSNPSGQPLRTRRRHSHA
jgi:transcriptional regulator with XRE-family HTH domain